MDAKGKLIIGSVRTSANVHNRKVFQDLLNETNNAVFADSAYRSEESERYVLEEYEKLSCSRAAEGTRSLKKRRRRTHCAAGYE